MNDVQVAEKASLKGVYTLTLAHIETAAQRALEAKIRALREAGKEIGDMVRLLNSMCRTEKMVIENLLPTVGRTAIAQHLSAVSPTPSSLLVNYGAVGTGTNAAANGDTTLQTETFRNAIASRTNANNVAYITIFLATTDVTGTLREVGLFINGSASANTGTLFSRAIINRTKTSIQTLTIDHTVTIS